MRILLSWLLAAAVASSAHVARTEIPTMEPDVGAMSLEPMAHEEPAPPTAPSLPDDHGGHALRLGGILLTVGGASNMAVGALTLRMGEQVLRECPGGCGLTTAQKWRLGMIVGGGIGLAAGVPMLVVGARRIERYQGEDGRGPSVAIAPDRATFTWRF